METRQRQYSVTVLPDHEGEPFSRSSCTCPDCRSAHLAQQEWDTFVPTTRLQARMLDVVQRIEGRIKSKA